MPSERRSHTKTSSPGIMGKVSQVPEEAALTNCPVVGLGSTTPSGEFGIVESMRFDPTSARMYGVPATPHASTPIGAERL